MCKFKVGSRVEFLGGTYGSKGMKGKVVSVPDDIVEVNVEGQIYQKHVKNLKLVKTK